MFDKLKAKIPRRQKEGKDITKDYVYELFEEFRSAYASEWERLERNELIYRGQQWDLVEKREKDAPEPVTNIIQSTVENIMADLMDNYPEAIVTPESPEDETIAAVVEALIKQNHDAANYTKEYWRLSYDLLVAGYMVQEVGYDPELNSSIGAAFIRHVDTYNIMFDPLSDDIQDGRAVIKYEGIPRKVIEKKYPDLTFESDIYKMSAISDDPNVQRDAEKIVLLIELWWREYDNGRYKVHMLKVAGGNVLEDSRKEKPDGYYSHGQYPFIVTPLFIRKHSPLGWGIVDMYAQRQMTADKIDQMILENAYLAGRNKMLVRKGAGCDIDDLRDWKKEVHEVGDLNAVTWMQAKPLPNYIFSYVENIRQTIKEESGSNDFSRGQTGGGVTAASAIAALQEMSGKRSRMAARQMQSAFKDAVRMEIEIEREFNLLPREVMITKNGQREKATFENALMMRETGLGNNVPIEFFISIKVQRENKWSVMAHNELVLQMVQMQIIPPVDALELMHFDGKESVLSRNQQQQQQAGPSPEEQAMEQMAAQMQQMPMPEQALGEQML